MKKLNRTLRTLHASGRARAVVTVLAGGLVTVVLLALLYRSHVTFERELTATFQQHQLTTAQTLAASVEEVFAEVEDDLQGLARHKHLLSETAPPQDEIDAYYETHTDILNNITVVSDEGNGICRSPKAPKKHNVSQWPEFLGVKDTHKPWIGEPAKCVVDPTETVVRIFVPIVANGRFEGAIYAGINLKKLWVKCMKRVETSRKSACWVIADNGQLLYHANSKHVGLTWEQIEDRWRSSGKGAGDEIDEDIEELAHRVRKRVQDGQEGTAEYLNCLEGVEELVAFTPIRLGNRTYGLAVVTPKSEMSAPIARQEMVTYALMAGLAVICVAGGYAVYRGGRARVLLVEERKHAGVLRQSGEALRKSEENFRLLVDGVTDYAIFMLDPDGIVISWNEAAHRIKGYEADEIIGKHFSVFCPPEDVQAGKPQQELKTAVDQGRFEEEGLRVRKDGSTFQANVIITPVRDEAGQLRGFAKVTRDITERKAAEEQLELAVSRWESTFDAVEDMVAVIGTDYRILLANRAMKERFKGVTVPGAFCYELIHGTDRPPETCRACKVFETGEPQRWEIQEEHLGGCWLDIATSPIKDERGKVQQIVHSAQDITERKKAAEELERHRHHLQELVGERTSQLEQRISEVQQLNTAMVNLSDDLRVTNVDFESTTQELAAANKELEAFAYSVSHDLRSPLRGMDGFSAALLEEYGDKLDEQGRNHLARVRAAAGRMGELIDDLLDLSRISRAEMERETVDLSALAKEIAADLQAGEPSRPVTFRIAGGLTAAGDRRLLWIALEKLIDNAWKFTSRHPKARIKFGVADVDNGRAFFVRDDGAGFDMAYAHKLFGPFQRLHSLEEFPGTGIGLATAQRIIHRHGGRIWARAEVEKGATFYFTLPQTPKA